VARHRRPGAAPGGRHALALAARAAASGHVPALKTWVDGSRYVVGEVPGELEGALVELGFSRDGACFRRSFAVDPADVLRTHARFAEHLEELVLQTARLRPAPWDDALELLLQRIGGAGVDWWLTGSAALALRGAEVAPRDLDLVTDDTGAQLLAEHLADVLVEPLQPADWFCRWWGRAFLGARVEWVGGVGSTADEPEPTDFGLVAAESLETVAWRGHAVRVPPLALQLAVCERRGLGDRAARIRALLA
jgi:Phosphoribosyl-dephospho-CoA transferase MdcG